MAKSKMIGRRWTLSEEQRLQREASGNTPTRVIGVHLKRSEDAVRSKASALGISLKPTNQPPYGSGGKRRK
ncbi:MAG: hypothetical protein WD757_01285 [Actinomycetota bacterium]